MVVCCVSPSTLSFEENSQVSYLRFVASSVTRRDPVIYSLSVLSSDLMLFILDVCCSKGLFYIESKARLRREIPRISHLIAIRWGAYAQRKRMPIYLT
jgi:hypothetical protein